MFSFFSPSYLRPIADIQEKIDHAQTVGLANALDQSESKSVDYFLRHIFREYAKTFLTPLHIVETLPLDFVLLHYYENVFENLLKEERPEIKELVEKERVRLSETEEEKRKRIAYEKENIITDDELVREAEEENKQNAIKQAKILQKQAEKISKELEKEFVAFKGVPEPTSYNGPIDFKTATQTMMPESALPGARRQPIKPLPPSFRIKYDEE